MIIELNQRTHILGFPYSINSDYHGDNNNNKKERKDAESDPYGPSIYQPLYETSNEYLKNGYNILYAAESLPDEQDKAKVVESIWNVDKNNNNEDAQNNISKGLLNVINSDTIYKDDANGIDIVNFLLSNVSEMQQRKTQQQQQQQQQENTKGTIIFNAPDPFFNHGKYDVFMNFEEEVGRRLPQDVGLLCWYKRKWLNNLSLSQVISTLVHHRHTIHSNWKYKHWGTNKIIEVISKGVDNNIGEGSSILLFQTLKSAYKLEQDAIVDRPDVFEERLKRVLGKDDANSVINSIFEEIIKEVEFGLTTNGSNSNKR